MIGKDYESFDEFQQACRNRNDSLDPSSVLGKVYQIDQLRYIVKVCDIDIENTHFEDQEIDTHQGVAKRYDVAKRMGIVQTPEEIGEVLSHLDHEFYFPILTYFGFPDAEPYSSPCHFLKELSRNDIEVSDDYVALFNGMTQPPSRACKLESIRVYNNGKTISLLFSCSRVLVVPGGQQLNFEDHFLARIPVVVRILFHNRLIEITMPMFSEPMGYSDTSHKPPERYQAVAQSAQAGLIHTVAYSPRSTSYSRIALYLESHLKAVDMGWTIQPQSDAEFDLTQAAIPLRDILHSFSTSIQRECTLRGIMHPLATLNLYSVFRALKEQSYTLSLRLQAPLGRRRGSVRIATYYGQPSSDYAPILYLSDNNSDISERLRDAVHESQVVAMANPYDLVALLTGQGSSS